MPKYNPDIHHRRSIRLQHYDYAQMGVYFVTLCTLNRECLFGEILAGKMHLNKLGTIVRDEWLQTPCLRSNVCLGEWVVMPNHFHGIVEINGQAQPRRGVLHTPSSDGCPTIKSPSQTLGAMVRGFKSAVTRQADMPVWQRNYWEYIIRNPDSHHDIATYITNNPAQWETDTLYS